MPCLKLPIEYYQAQKCYRGFFERPQKRLYGDFCTVTEDDIGNLKTENRNGNVFKYTANNVNQYTERTVPSRINISGSADAASTVTIKQTSAGYTRPLRYGNYFNAFFNLDNSTNAATDSFDIYAVKFDGTKDIVAKQTLNVFVPKTPEQFTYDNDGNLLSDGRFLYTWNGENRLISAVETGKQKIEYAYDYNGRRYERKSYSWNGADWTLASTIKYVYDGNNVIAEYDAANNLLKSYLWGEDVSGSLQGAGGVGGLLAVNNYLPVYDGNGNVMSYINATNGTVCAEYQYNPFGKIISKSGTNADSFKILFSTKYYDKETETFYYLYRDYKPEISRWLSRDPIGINGGKNIYCFNKNNSISNIDQLGLYTEETRQDVLRGDIQYSCNCGWIDWSHATTSNAGSLIDAIKNENGKRSLQDKNGFYVYYQQDMQRYGISLAKGQEYWVKLGLSESQKNSVALKIFMEVTESFESFQANFGFGFTEISKRVRYSGFGEEDLPSNLIAFYSAVKNYTTSEVREWCKVIDKPGSGENSVQIFDRDGLRKNHSWKPVYHKTDCCKNKAGKWPSQFSSIKPASKGGVNANFRDWAFSYDEYEGDVFWGP